MQGHGPSQCNQLHDNVGHSIYNQRKLAHTHTHTQHCTGHAPLPVTAPEQEQQNLHRDLMLPWYSQSHHRSRRRLAVDRAMTALVAAWQQRCMHAVTVHMGHSWRLHMHSLQQIQGLRCSQKLLQGQARVYSGLC